MNAPSDDLTPDQRSLATRLGALPYPGPDAASRSRMRTRFEETLATPRAPWWARRLYLGAIVAALALGLGAAGAASRSPVDVVRDPGGVMQDIVRNVTSSDEGPSITTCDHDDDDDCDDDDREDRGDDDRDDRDDDDRDDRDDRDDDDNSGPGVSDDDGDHEDDNSGPGSGDDHDDDDVDDVHDDDDDRDDYDDDDEDDD